MQKGEGTRKHEMFVGWEQSARNMAWEQGWLPVPSARGWCLEGPRAWFSALLSSSGHSSVLDSPALSFALSPTDCVAGPEEGPVSEMGRDSVRWAWMVSLPGRFGNSQRGFLEVCLPQPSPQPPVYWEESHPGSAPPRPPGPEA